MTNIPTSATRTPTVGRQLPQVPQKTEEGENNPGSTPSPGLSGMPVSQRLTHWKAIEKINTVKSNPSVVKNLKIDLTKITKEEQHRGTLPPPSTVNAAPEQPVETPVATVLDTPSKPRGMPPQSPRKTSLKTKDTTVVKKEPQDRQSLSRYNFKHQNINNTEEKRKDTFDLDTLLKDLNLGENSEPVLENPEVPLDQSNQGVITNPPPPTDNPPPLPVVLNESTAPKKPLPPIPGQTHAGEDNSQIRKSGSKKGKITKQPVNLDLNKLSGSQTFREKKAVQPPHLDFNKLPGSQTFRERKAVTFIEGDEPPQIQQTLRSVKKEDENPKGNTKAGRTKSLTRKSFFKTGAKDKKDK